MGRLVTGSDNVHAGSGLVNRIFSVLKRLNLQDLLLDMLRKLGMPFISKREKGPPGARMGSRGDSRGPPGALLLAEKGRIESLFLRIFYVNHWPSLRIFMWETLRLEGACGN